MPDSELLTHGIAAARAGDKARARVFLVQAVKADPRCADAWWWLAQCLDDPRQRADCLRRVRAIDPSYAPMLGPRSDVRSTGARTPLGSVAPSTESPKELTPVPGSPSGPANGLGKQLGVVGSGFVAGTLLVVMAGFYVLRHTNLLPPGTVGWLQTTATSTASNSALLPSLLGSTWTPTPSRTPLPATATPLPPTATVEMSYEQRLNIAQKDIDRANQLMGDEKFGEALLAWDDVLNQVPEFGSGHYQRAQTYLHLLSNNRYLDEYLVNLQAALDDIDLAIALEPATNGDHYYTRYDIYAKFSDVSDWRIDQEMMTSIALENLRMATALGTSDPYAERYVPILLANLGRCEEAIAESNRLIQAEGPGAPPSGYLNYGLAVGYLCKGDLTRALKHVDISIGVTPTEYRQRLRALILFEMGRFQEAKDQLDELIEAQPAYGGGRYYLRAAARAEMGDYEGAQDDLWTGQGSTWGKYSMASYAQALIDFHAGDREAGIEDLKLAEASFSKVYGPLLERVRADLKEMDVAVLEPSPVFTMTGTPIVMPPATPTARPTQPGSKPAPQGAIVVDLSAGTGPLVLRPNDYPVYRFQPPSPVRYKSVESLTVELETEHPAGIPDLQLYFWSPESGGWREQDAVWGANVIDSPWIPVGAQGDVYVGLRNWGAETIYLENVRIILVVLNNADEKIVIGPDEP